MDLTEIRSLTRTNSTSFTDADIYRKANIVYKEIQSEIIQATGQRNSFIKQTRTNLIKADGLSEGDIGYNGEYGLPSDCIIPVRIEAKLENDLIPTVVYDQSSNPTSEWVEDDLDRYSASNPRIRFIRNSILLRPLPKSNVDKGLYIEYIGNPTELSGENLNADFLPLFYDVINLGVAKRFFLSDVTKYTSDLVAIRDEYEKATRRMIVFFQDRMPKNLRFSSNAEYRTSSFK
jgi:hypothetical protein